MFNRHGLNTWIRKALMCIYGTLNLIFLAFDKDLAIALAVPTTVTLLMIAGI